MLDQRRRRWANIKLPLVQRHVVFIGWASTFYEHRGECVVGAAPGFSTLSVASLEVATPCLRFINTLTALRYLCIKHWDKCIAWLLRCWLNIGQRRLDVQQFLKGPRFKILLYTSKSRPSFMNVFSPLFVRSLALAQPLKRWHICT